MRRLGLPCQSLRTHLFLWILVHTFLFMFLFVAGKCQKHLLRYTYYYFTIFLYIYICQLWYVHGCGFCGYDWFLLDIKPHQHLFSLCYKVISLSGLQLHPRFCLLSPRIHRMFHFFHNMLTGHKCTQHTHTHIGTHPDYRQNTHTDDETKLHNPAN